MTGRHFAPGRLVVATHNAGKLMEILQLLGPYGVDPVAAGDLGLPEPEENGPTFIANAEIKARAAATATNLPALADDSGIVIESLDGAPGIYTARWAGPRRDFALAMRKTEDELAARGHGIDNPQAHRRAHFVCAFVLCWPDGHTEAVEGSVAGRVTWPPRGTHGFGYDPIFIPDGYSRTFGEMLPQAKQPLTHRTQAFDKLVARCFFPT